MRKLFGLIVIAGITGAVIYCGFWGMVARERFGSKKWELPARVYSRPLELYPGLSLNADYLARELSLMSYRRTERLEVPGSYSVKGNVIRLFSRPFTFPDGREEGQKIRIEIRDGKIFDLTDIEAGNSISIARLDPAIIGSFYPVNDEDRLWVRFEDAPPLLIQTIMAVEDRDFYDHHGDRKSTRLNSSHYS